MYIGHTKGSFTHKSETTVQGLQSHSMSATETNCKYLERNFDSLEMFYFTPINFSIMFVRSASGHDLHIFLS